MISIPRLVRSSSQGEVRSARPPGIENASKQLCAHSWGRARCLTARTSHASRVRQDGGPGPGSRSASLSWSAQPSWPCDLLRMHPRPLALRRRRRRSYRRAQRGNKPMQRPTPRARLRARMPRRSSLSRPRSRPHRPVGATGSHKRWPCCLEQRPSCRRAMPRRRCGRSLSISENSPTGPCVKNGGQPRPRRSACPGTCQEDGPSWPSSRRSHPVRHAPNKSVMPAPCRLFHSRSPARAVCMTECPEPYLRGRAALLVRGCRNKRRACVDS